MSIGNLKDTGNQGNNLPFQWKVLQGLQQLVTQVSQPLNCAEDSVKICGTTDGSDTSPIYVGKQKCDNALAVTLCDEQAQLQITPVITNSVGTVGDLSSLAGFQLLSISFASNGTADARVSVDGGSVYYPLPPGTTINLDAGGVMNYYNPELIYWDTQTNVGASLLIVYNWL